VQANEAANTDRLLFARDLVDALERGDAAAELAAVHAILGLHEKRLHSNLSRIASDLREALSASQFPTELSRIARSELPDAQQRLNRVIELTEAAADTSLTAVETALPLAKDIRLSIEQLGASASGDTAADSDDRPLIGLLNRIAADAAEIEKCLSDILMAQGFQDITGQIIRRIVKLVAELEEHLSATALPGGPHEDERSADLHRGNGPALNGIDKSALEHQQDVDDLLGQLGL